jgi:hypothetical protein
MDFIFVGAGNLWTYIKNDWKSNKIRFCAEVFAWACSVVSAIMFAATVPNIPVVPLYTIFIAGCASSAWACYTRRSFGLMANSVFLVVIDGTGLIRYLLTS